MEIWFVAIEGKLYVLAERFHEAQWVKNIKHNPRARVRLGDRQFDRAARVLDEERDGEHWRLVQRLAHKKYGWGEGLPVEIIPSTD
jgi:deazaflavin-dependent oxidoreductase (nitroreductase family)